MPSGFVQDDSSAMAKPSSLSGILACYQNHSTRTPDKLTVVGIPLVDYPLLITDRAVAMP